jgi:YidC/Oxa1 family membrane protein insertase
VFATAPAVAASEPALISIDTESLRIRLSARDGSLVGLEACYPVCRERPGVRIRSVVFAVPNDAGSGIHGWAGDPAERPAVPFEYRRETIGGVETVEFHSPPLADGARPGIRYSIPRTGYRLGVDVAFEVGAATALKMGTTRRFIPAPLPGFAAEFARVRAVLIDSQGEVDVEPGNSVTLGADAASGQWVGVRNRFWALLAHPQNDSGVLRVEEQGENLPRLDILDDRNLADRSSRKYALYAGPMSAESLRETSPVLKSMLYPGLWEWLRALCFALAWLLDMLYGWIGNYGIAIIALALVVKVLMLPLTALAEYWHRQVNRTQSSLQPLIDAIKTRSSGEEQSEQIFALYREHGVHPLYSLKSLAGFLIQIPVFIAVFAMLGQHFQLSAVPFLWIQDLTRPDALSALPVSLPFFGEHFNLLPLLMTLITILSSLAYRDETLTEPLLRRQRVKLYWMAALFFVLFYTFPAGMVLYWTTSNLLHFLKEQLKRLLPLPLRGRPRVGYDDRGSQR